MCQNQAIFDKIRQKGCRVLENRKSFLANEALNIRLSCTDIFKSYIYSFHAEYGNIVIDQSNSNFRPCIQLRVSYRFNSANSKYKGTGAGQEAKDRM